MTIRDTVGTPVDVTEVKIRLVDESSDGLLGWASCVVNGALYLNNIAIRRSRTGELALAYPSSRSRSDQKHFYFNPITREAKLAIDEAVLGKLLPKDIPKVD